MISHVILHTLDSFTTRETSVTIGMQVENRLMYVRIVEGCIACGVCESLCPEVFTVLETSEADNSRVPGCEDACREAASACPVNVIKVEE